MNKEIGPYTIGALQSVGNSFFLPSEVLEDRLIRQQRDMEEERNRLQEVISKMEARLNEQTRLLEQVSYCWNGSHLL